METYLIIAFVIIFVLIFGRRGKNKAHADIAPSEPFISERAIRPKKSAPPEEFVKYQAKLRKNAIAAFEHTKKNAVSVGSPKYIWRTSNDSDVCPICAKNNGKKFSWNKPPEHGHPGYGTCSNDGHCRCFAEPVIPD